jgi:hypothetical protein
MQKTSVSRVAIRWMRTLALLRKTVLGKLWSVSQEYEMRSLAIS